MAAAGKKQNKRSGVLICGAYGMSNAGDEAVLSAMLAEMRSIDPDMPLTVLSRSPADTERIHGVKAVHMFNVPAFLRVMRRSRLYINGGGSLIQDVTSSRSLWYYLFTLYAAKKCGCRVMMYGCGVGPVERPRNRALAGRIINRCVDAVTLRETHSRSVLESFGVTKPEVHIASDPALFLRPAPDAETDAALSRLGLGKDERCFCLCLRRWPGIREKTPLFAQAADYAWNTYGLRPVLLSVNPQQDNEVACAVCAAAEAPCVVVTEQLPLGVTVGLLGRMRAVMAMRLHVLVFSASRAVPLIGISYDPKVSAFLDYLSQTNYAEFGEIETAEQLFAMIDRAAAADRETLRARTAEIMAVERCNVETARRLLEEAER